MGRRILYRIEDVRENSLTEEEWGEISRLQFWYNSEFGWTAGKLAFKRYVVFPNTEEFQGLNVSIWELIAERQRALAEKGLSERDRVSQLEKDRLVIVKWGGYFDGCLASGFTRVADNEWNAFLVCDFLLKASTLCKNATILLADEGKFVKTGKVGFKNGVVLVPRHSVPEGADPEDLVAQRHIFTPVDASRYDKHPVFKNLIPGFNQMQAHERKELVQNWNWLGYGDSASETGNTDSTFDLNAKVRRVDFFD